MMPFAGVGLDRAVGHRTRAAWPIIPVTALGGTAIFTTRASCRPLRQLRGRKTRFGGSTAHRLRVRIVDVTAVPPAALKHLFDAVGQPGDFGFRAFDADDDLIADFGLRIADCEHCGVPAEPDEQINRYWRRFEIRQAIEQHVRRLTRSAHSATIVAEHSGLRLHFERQLRDDAERAERTGEQFAEVVAGDVFHHAAAAFERDAAAIDGVDADHVVANRAVAVASRAAPIRGHHAADRGFGARGTSIGSCCPSAASVAARSAIRMPASTRIVMSRGV